MSNVVQIQLEAKVQWNAIQGAGKGIWIGVCDALNLSVEADSLDELHNLIPESIQLLMMDLVMDNEFDQYLLDRGWQAKGVARPDELEETEFRVPWHLLVPEGRNGTERRLS
jgi:Domain of unknown function (DUF1902)